MFQRLCICKEREHTHKFLLELVYWREPIPCHAPQNHALRTMLTPILTGTVHRTVPYELAQTLPISISPAAWTIAFRFAHVCRVTHVERALTVLMLTQAPHACVLFALLLRYSLFRHNPTRYCIDLRSASHQTCGRRSIVLQAVFFGVFSPRSRAQQASSQLQKLRWLAFRSLSLFESLLLL